MDIGANELTSSRTNNEWADFWRDEIGVNVLPVNGVTKRPLVDWKYGPVNYQNESISDDQHDQCKKDGMFDGGMAAIMGRVWRGPNEGKYITGIDADKMFAYLERT